MDQLPATRQPGTTPAPFDPGFTEEFAYQVALGSVPFRDICVAQGVSLARAKHLMADANFRRRLAEYRDQLSKAGVSSELKASVAVDTLIPDMYDIAKDKDEPSANRMAAFDRLMKVSGKDKPQVGPTTPQFMLQVVLPESVSSSEAKLITGIPVTVGM